MPLKACAMLILISLYLGGPQTVRYGFAAVSSDPRPLPVMKMATQKPPKERYTSAGQAMSEPMPYKQRPQMKQAL